MITLLRLLLKVPNLNTAEPIPVRPVTRPVGNHIQRCSMLMVSGNTNISLLLVVNVLFIFFFYINLILDMVIKHNIYE